MRVKFEPFAKALIQFQKFANVKDDRRSLPFGLVRVALREICVETHENEVPHHPQIVSAHFCVAYPRVVEVVVGLDVFAVFAVDVVLCFGDQVGLHDQSKLSDLGINREFRKIMKVIMKISISIIIKIFVIPGTI